MWIARANLIEISWKSVYTERYDKRADWENSVCFDCETDARSRGILAWKECNWAWTGQPGQTPDWLWSLVVSQQQSDDPTGVLSNFFIPRNDPVWRHKTLQLQELTSHRNSVHTTARISRNTAKQHIKLQTSICGRIFCRIFNVRCWKVSSAHWAPSEPCIALHIPHPLCLLLIKANLIAFWYCGFPDVQKLDAGCIWWSYDV